MAEKICCNNLLGKGFCSAVAYGLETVVSVLFSNTCTRLLYNELAYCTMLHSASIHAVLKISSSLYSKQVRVFENKTRTNSL